MDEGRYRKTWDVRNDSGITMRTINKEKREII